MEPPQLTFDGSSERAQTLTSGSVELFAFPWSRISPYAIGGVTWAAGGFDDQVFIDGALMFDRDHPETNPVMDFELGQPGEGDRK